MAGIRHRNYTHPLITPSMPGHLSNERGHDEGALARARRMARELSDGELRTTLARDGASLQAEAVQALKEEVERRRLRVHPWADQSYFPVTTTPEVDGYRVIRVIDVVGAEYVLGIDIFREFLAGIRDVIGGRSETLQKQMRFAREACFREIREQAYSLKADAVLGLAVQLSEFSGQGKSMILMQATGTAVELTADGG